MRVKYSKILMWLLILSPMVDNINGLLLLQQKSAYVSIIFKTLILVVCLLALSKISLNKMFLFVLVSIIIFIMQSMWFELRSEAGYLVNNLIIITRLFSPIIIGYTFTALNQYDASVPICINKIISFYCWFFPLSLIIPELFNLAYSTYSSGLGTKGFYYAGNEISSVMTMILAIRIKKYMKDRKRAQLVNLLLIIISYLMIATKSSYISVIILLLMTLFLNRGMIHKLRGLLISAGAAAFVFALLYRDYISEFISVLYYKYYQRYNNVLSMLLSARNEKLLLVAREFYKKNPISRFLFGAGMEFFEKGFYGIIEMDFFDLLFQFGMVGVCLIVGLYFVYAKRIIVIQDKWGIMTVLLIAAQSFTAGHVLFAPMVNNVLILVILYFCFKEEAEQSEVLQHNE